MIEKWVIFKRDYLEISFLRKIADTTVWMNADDISLTHFHLQITCTLQERAEILVD